MEHITLEKIQALALSGGKDPEIVAALGRGMTQDEREAVYRVRMAAKLKRQAARQRGPLSASQKMRDMRARDRLIAYSDPEDAKRRKRLEKDPAKWLQWYLPDRFPLAFGEVHKQIISACIRAMTTGTSITDAAPRGFGKTSLLWGMALFGVLTGLTRFPVVIGWKSSAGAELLDQWLGELSGNERLAADYPCQCAPFAESVQSTRLKGILRKLDPEEKAGCDVRKVRGLVILPDVQEPTTGRRMKQCALGGASMNGSIKGLNVGLLSGETLRPDVALLDDPQDEKTADSEALVKKVIKKIDYGIRSLAGPRRRLTVMAAVTCVNVGDVSEHLLTRPGTEIINIGQITTWPDGWADKDSTVRAMWDEWNAERLDGLQNLDGGKKARAYYRAHKAEMTAGMSVSWNERYHVGDDVRPGDPDALFAAMWDFYDLGELAFMAERQNEPIKEGVSVYALKPEHIIARTDHDRPPFYVPEWSRLVVAATDLNPSYAFTWGVDAFGGDQRNGVVAYGFFKEPPLPIDSKKTPAEKERLLFEALVMHGRQLAALPCRPSHWGVDAGGAQFSAVLKFSLISEKECGLKCIPMTGRAGKTYNPHVKTRVGMVRNGVYECYDKETRAKWLCFDADFYREVAHLAWLGTIGAPGSCSLFAGRHDEWAAQICAEKLNGKAEIAGRMVYNWTQTPNAPHDAGDVHTMFYALAGWNGIGTGGTVEVVESRRKKYTQAQLRR